MTLSWVVTICTDYYNFPAWIGVASISIFMFGFCIGLGPASWIYISDILPAVGISLSTTVIWITMGLIGYFFPMIRKNYSLITAFDIFLGFSILSLLFLVVFIEETKGKT